MKREIRFKAKSKEKGEWVFGMPIYKPFEDKCFMFPPQGICGSTGVEVDPDTVSQYIGSTDANGTEIYEGDIFKDSYYDWDDEKEIEYYITVKWDEPSCGFIVSQSDYHDEVEMHHLANNEIIGNVHDNPELLEELDV